MLRKLEIMDLVKPSASLKHAGGDIDVQKPMTSFGDMLDAQFQDAVRPIDEIHRGDAAPLQRIQDAEITGPAESAAMAVPQEMRNDNRSAESYKKDQAAEPVQQKAVNINDDSSTKDGAVNQAQQRRSASARESSDRQVKKESGVDMQSLIAPRLDAILSILKNMQASGTEKNEMSKLASSIKDVLSKKNADPGAMKELAERLSQLLKKLSDHGGGRNTLPAMALLKSEAERALDVLKSRNRKAGSPAFSDESVQREARTHLFNKLAQGTAAPKEERREQGNGSNSSNSFSLQFAKNTQQADRQAPVQTGVPRAPLFDEQLQNLLQGARVTVKDGKNGTLSLQLRPESLGRVTVNLGLEQGTLSGRFLVESLEAKQALMGQMDAIVEDLRGAGISVGDFQVNVRGGEDRAAREEQWKGAVVTGAPLEKAGASYEMPVMMKHAGAVDVVI